MARIIPWILTLAFCARAYSEAADYTCQRRTTDGTGTFIFDENQLNEEEFSLSFGVMANSDVRIILSPQQDTDTAAYVITIGDRNDVTSIARWGGSSLKSSAVSETDPLRSGELSCGGCMSPYWMCYQNGMIKLGRGNNAIPYFEYEVPAGETFNPRFVGFSTGSASPGLFGSIRIQNQCGSQGSGTDIQVTTRPPRDCRPADCGSVTCLFGFKVDESGCDTCECKDSPCQLLVNCMPCKHGYEKDAFKCDTCTCTPGPCDNEPCQNDGYCYGVGRTDYGCICTEGYDGKNCENDVQNPSIICPEDMTTTTDPTSPSASITYEPATGSDNSGQDPTIVCTPNTPTLPVGSNTIQCIATDGSSNTASCTYKITVEDKEPPTPICPDPMERPTEGGKAYATIDYEIPAVTDNSDPNPEFVCDLLPGVYEFTVGETTVTCTTSDKYENSDSCQFTVTIKDEEAPKFDCPLPMDDVPVQTGEAFAIINYELPTVTDNVDEGITVTCEDEPGSQFPIGKTVVICTSMDEAGNTKICPFNITVKDNEGPQITCPELIRQTTDVGLAYATVTYDTPVATDNSDPNPTVVCELPSGSKFWMQTNTVTCTATDNVDNSESCSFDVVITDEEPPTITCPEPMEDVPTDKGRDVAPVTYNDPVRADNEDRNPAVSCDKDSGSEFDLGRTDVTCTVTDRSSNSAECSFFVEVIDLEKPVIRCPGPMPESPTDDGLPTRTVAYPDPTSTDNADPNPQMSCIPPTDTAFPIGTTVVKCTATDVAGNKDTCPFEIKILDNEEPVLECPIPMERPTDTGVAFATVDYPLATSTDNAGPSPTVQCFEPSGSEFSLGQTVVECTASDEAGNEGSCTFTIDVIDVEKPELQCPSAMTEPVDAGQDFATVRYSAPIASDNADPFPDVSCKPASGSQFPLSDTEVVCKAIDDADNRKRCTFVVTVEDKEGPTIECPLPMPEPADFGSSSTVVNYDNPIVTDNTDDNPTFSCTPLSGERYTIGETDVTCTALDEAGNTNECSFTVVVKDVEPPEFACPVLMPVIMEASESFGIVTYDLPVATDNWDAEVPVVCTPESGTQLNGGSTEIVCSAVDVARNKRNCTVTVEVFDDETPELTCPDSMDRFVEAGQAYAQVDFDIPTATDNADPSPTVECTVQPNTRFDIGTNEVTCTAQDKSRNLQDCTFTITVTDNEKPKLTCPAAMNDVSTNAGENFATVNYVLQPVTDNADASPTVDCQLPSGSSFPLGQSTITCVASDKYSNSKECSFPVNVVDKEEPKITCPASVSQTTEPGQSYAKVTYAVPTATDNADPDPFVSCEKPSGSKFWIAPNVVVCTARDKAGNSAQCTFPVQVKDEEKPKITCPIDMSASFESGKPYATLVYTKPSATDNVDPSPTVDCTPVPNSQLSQIGPNVVKCSATDKFSNRQECDFTVEVSDDEKPKVTCPADMTRSADPGQSFATIDYDVPVATDNADLDPDVVCSPLPSTPFNIGTKTVTCTASDSNGNINTCRFSVTVTDDEAPVLTCSSTSISRNTDAGKDYSTVDYTRPVAVDNADFNPTVVCDKDPGTQFPPGSNPVSCSASDTAGNSATCTFTVRVTDKEEPKVTCPEPMNEFTDSGQKFATVAYDEPVATDNVDKPPALNCEPKPNSQFDIGVSEVVCTALDLAGNRKTCKFGIDVNDNEKPELTCPVDMTRSADLGQRSTVVSYVVPNGLDNSGVEPTVVCDPPSGSPFTIGQNTVTCKATDGSENVKTCPFDIIVTDDEPPKVTCPEPMKKSLDAGKAYATLQYANPIATDNFDRNLVVTCDITSGSQLETGLNTITCTTADTANNKGSCSFTVRVTDDEAPKFDCPLSMTTETDPRLPTAEASYTTPVAEDNKDGSVTVTCSPPPGTPLGVRANTVTCTATDSAGNVKTCPFTITVEDKEEPQYQCPTPMPDVSIDPGQAYATVAYALPEVTDNVDSNLPLICVEPPGSKFPIGKSTVTCRAIDTEGNTNECSFTITVGDNEAPKFDCPIDMTVETDPRVPTASVSYTVPTATDSVEGTVAVACVPGSGTPLGVGTTTVECTAVDSSGNSKTCPFQITVEDKEIPQFECPINMDDMSADPGEEFATFDYALPSITDNVDKDITVTCEKVSGSQFPIGTSQITCSASDVAGNSKSCSFSVEVKDKESPKLTCPDSLSEDTDLGQDYATVTYALPTATDNADLNPLVSCDRAPGAQFWIEPNEVVCTATDKYKNVATCNFPVEVTDKEKPTLTCPDPMNGLSTDRRKSYATVDYPIPVGQDNADGSPVVSCDKLPGTPFDLGDNLVTCTVTDMYGNSADCSFNINVIDDERPRILCPAPMPDVTTDEGLATALIVYALATAEDNADPSPTVTCTPASNTAFAVGSTIVKCKAIDDVGNKRGCNFQIDVADDEEPEMACPGPMSVSTDPKKPFASVNYEVPIATDNVDTTLAVACAEPPNSEFSLGLTTVVCTVKDSSENQATCDFTIDVVDDEKPELDCPVEMTEPVDAGESFATVEYVTPIATDNADLQPDVDCQPPSTSQLPVGPNEIVCRANDDAGNENTCTFTVIVKDNEGPTIECPIPMPASADPGSTSTVVSYEDPIVSDNTDPDPSVSCTPPSGSEFQIGENEVTCTATDDADNSNECTFKVVIRDDESPDLTCPGLDPVGMDAEASIATVLYDVPTATDNWDISPTVACSPPPGSAFKAGATLVVCTAIDESHNRKNCSFTIEVEDREKPQVTCPVDMTEFVDPGEAFATADYDIPTATDNADPRPTVNCNLKPESQFPIGANEVICRARDASENRQKCTFVVTVIDNEPPKFTCPNSKTSVSADKGQSFATVGYILSTPTDNADPAPTVDCDKPSGTEFPLGSNTIVCTALDMYQNSKECTFRVEVIDDEGPEFDCPIPMNTSTDPGLPSAVVSYPVPIATDNAEGEVPVTCIPKSGTVFSVGEGNVTCSAKDSKGNTKICPFTITVEDKEKPEFDCPIPMSDQPVEPGQAYGLVSYQLPDATDNVDSNMQVYCVPTPGSKFPIGTTDVSCVVTDSAKNSKRCSFPIEVKDDEGPKFDCPLPMTEDTDDGLPTAEVFYNSPIATDNADGELPVTCTPSPNSAFPFGTNTVICSVADEAGNYKECPFTITVEDNEQPKFECPVDMTDIPNTAGKKSAIVEYDVPSATDNVDGIVTVDCEKQSGSEFPVGTSEVRCSATDSSGNLKTCSFDVTVKDTEEPEFECPIDMTTATDKGSSTAAAAYVTPTATDNADGSVPVTCDPKVGSPLGIGTTIVTCTATDVAGNTRTCPFDITVKDEEAPEFECPLAMEDVTVDAGKNYGTVVYQTPVATDNVDYNLVVTCVPPSGSQFPVGQSEVTCTTTDQASNEKSCSFPIKVGDNEAPKFDCPVTMTVSTDPNLPSAVISYTVTPATDNVDGSVAVACSPESGSVLGVGTTIVECSAMDSSDNTKTCSFPIKVEDREEPQFECPLSQEMTADPGQSYATVDYVLPAVTDNVNNDLVVNCKKPPGSQFGFGNTKVTCSATDSANNMKTCTFHIDVTDDEAPQFDCPLDMTQNTDQGVPTAAVQYVQPTATDNVDGNVHVTCSPAPGTPLRVGVNTVDCVASDSSGNTKSCPFTITVQDKEEPDFTCPTPKNGVSVDPGQTYATVTYPLPRVSDNVDCSSTLSVICVEPSGSQFPIGTNDITCTATDMAGNSKSCTFQIEVKDDEAPEFDCPLPMTKETDTGLPSWAAAYTEPTATDNLDGSVPVSCSPAPGTPLDVGTTTVTCTAADSNDNTKTCQFSITVEDKEPPDITCPVNMDNQSPDQGQIYATVVYTLPVATDNKDQSPAISCDKVQGFQFPISVTTVTCTATDNAQNSNTCSFTVEVKDTTPPVVNCPIDMTYDTPADVDFVPARDTSATDDDGSSRTVTCDNSQMSYSNGRNTVTCQASDSSGNVGTCTFDIIIDPVPCSFETEANSWNTYLECATPVTPTDRTRVCFTGSSPHQMYVGIWYKQDAMLQPGMIDLTILDNELDIAHNAHYDHILVPGFSTGSPKLCVERRPAEIVITYEDSTLYATPTEYPKTEVGFASSDVAEWVALSTFGIPAPSRRRRSAGDDPLRSAGDDPLRSAGDDPLRTAVKRRRRAVDSDNDDGPVKARSNRYDKRRR